MAAAGALFVLAAMPNLALAAVVAVWLGAFCGLAWVSGYTLLQENVEDEFRGRTFASLTTLSRLGLFLSLTVFPILSSVYVDYEFYIGGQRFDLSGTGWRCGPPARSAWRRASTPGVCSSATVSPGPNLSRSCRS